MSVWSSLHDCLLAGPCHEQKESQFFVKSRCVASMTTVTRIRVLFTPGYSQINSTFPVLAISVLDGHGRASVESHVDSAPGMMATAIAATPVPH